MEEGGPGEDDETLALVDVLDGDGQPHEGLAHMGKGFIWLRQWPGKYIAWDGTFNAVVRRPYTMVHYWRGELCIGSRVDIFDRAVGLWLRGNVVAADLDKLDLVLESGTVVYRTVGRDYHWLQRAGMHVPETNGFRPLRTLRLVGTSTEIW